MSYFIINFHSGNRGATHVQISIFSFVKCVTYTPSQHIKQNK